MTNGWKWAIRYAATMSIAFGVIFTAAAPFVSTDPWWTVAIVALFVHYIALAVLVLLLSRAPVRRVSELEAVLAVARRALDPDAPKGTADLARAGLTGQLDSGWTLDAMLDIAWRDGRSGRRHPCHDSPCADSRALAERSEATR